jgi:hypothetical protein
MLFNRTSSIVAIGLFAILLASPALGQGPEGMQLFGPADLSTFGSGPRPNEGYFLSFDAMYMALQPPNAAKIGATGSRNVGTSVIQVIGPFGGGAIQTYKETSTADTGALTADFEAAQRWEFGRVEDNRGWLASIFRWGKGQQNFSTTQTNVLFDDPIDTTTKPAHGLLYGEVGTHTESLLGVTYTVRDDYDLPIVFDQIKVRNTSDVWGVEASYLRRFMTFHDGGNMELYLGVRYLEFNERFSVVASGGVLDTNTYWNTNADNHIVGPQVGGRYFKQQGRWIFSTEGRFMAGFNRQNIVQEGGFGCTGGPSTLMKPIAWMGSQYSHWTTMDEFSPVVELRLDARYVITRNISVRAGWTGVWMDGIARPSSMITYAVPTMGIDTTHNRQSVFVNGVAIGFDINR